MKKIVVLMFALCLALPAISYAGNATSRFDLNIGGNIKVDIGWSDESNGTLGAGGSLVSRDYHNNDLNAAKKYGTQLWGAGETGLNFFVRGPDAWGAKTSAFISGDFTGVWGGSNYNTYNLVIATINLDWTNTSLTIGQSPQVWGKLPTWSNQVAWAGQNLATKGSAPNMINVLWTQRWTKEFTSRFGISSVNGANSANDFPAPHGNDSFIRADAPLFQGAINWSSGACGKVGPWQLTFGTAGVYGWQKEVFGPTNKDDNVPMYIADFKFLVPIIPEKNGNKTGAFYVDGAASYSQNASAFIGPMGGIGGVNLKYNRNNLVAQAPQSTWLRDPEWSMPQIVGYLGHAAYYFTDAFQINGYFGYATVASSQVIKRIPAGVNLAENTRQVAVSLLYDVNPALRFAVQWDQTLTKYENNPAARAAGQKNEGRVNDYRFAAYYFF